MQEFEKECQDLGAACAQARLRLDERGPEAYQRAYLAFRGAKQFPSYYVRKWLGLRLSAIKRRMVVDATVTPDFISRITDGRCPVTLESFDIEGKSPRNPSVDRLVNDLTYLAGNICVLSMRANRAKGDKTFEEVAQLAQAGEPAEGLEPVEWMRLASLMYGAWARAGMRGDPYLLPLAAIPGNGMFMSTSQVVQLLLTQQSLAKLEGAELEYWHRLTVDGGGQTETFRRCYGVLTNALAEEDFAGNAWLHGEVFEAFVAWFNSCHRAILPAIESLLDEHQRRRADPVATRFWPTGGRYHH